MPIVRVVDFETTSESPDSGVVIESGCWDYRVDDGEIYPSEARFWWSDKIPPENRAIHHISLDMAQSAPGSVAFDGDSFALWGEMDGIDCWAAHNASFEMAFFNPRQPMICTYRAALRVWPDLASHSNGAVFYWLLDQGKIQPDLTLTQPTHRAGPDAYVTAWILKALFDEGVKGAEMVKWTKEPALLPRCPIGEWRGKPWTEIDAGFLKWAIGKPSMSEEIKWNCKRELERRNG